MRAPCCCDCEPVVDEQLPLFDWEGAREDAEESVARAVPHLQKIVPPDVVVLPVQTCKLLNTMVRFDDINVAITGKTDYIFVPDWAWKDCQERFGAELAGGWQLTVEVDTVEDALRSLGPSIVGMYEAKTTLRGVLKKVHGQALLEYLAANQMQDWPTNDVIVLYGDLNEHYVVHAGRKDAGQPTRSLHVASPPSARMPSVAEHAPAAAEVSSSKAVTLGFIRALLRTPRTKEAGGSGVGAAGAGGGGAASSRGGGGGGVATSSRGGGGGAGGSGNDAASSCGGDGGAGGSEGDAASSRGGDGGARGSGGGATTSHGGPAGDSGDACSSSGADRSGGDEEGFDGDEGLLEAAQENADAQTWLSILRLPEVYESQGLKEPPTSFQPPTKEALLRRIQPYRG
ncbi:hypothetical protein HYH03_000928 [Edaphochlamys debaryana]|uniref:Uncharacterized protein n=1 Tax=Edaphochlamys debaryana TaxID=47281 RepID=A0A835YM96_9CHLO|nr:hypothetical protein HYH03_000928 [Edaphochlamys debaryana]|eukprot:KAG2501110.1 hypothetical protein HYH03_000928 [Edaphochlamys debaryana]